VSLYYGTTISVTLLSPFGTAEGLHKNLYISSSITTTTTTSFFTYLNQRGQNGQTSAHKFDSINEHKRSYIIIIVVKQGEPFGLLNLIRKLGSSRFFDESHLGQFNFLFALRFEKVSGSLRPSIFYLFKQLDVVGFVYILKV